MASEPMHAFDFTMPATYGQTEKFSACEKPLSFSTSHLFFRSRQTIGSIFPPGPAQRDQISGRGREDRQFNNSSLNEEPSNCGSKQMPRATNAPASRERRKRVLKKAKGYRGRRSKLFRYAKDATMKGQYWAYRDRKTRKRTFRYLWIQRLNAAARANGMTYSRFAEGLKAAGIGLDRKILSDLAVTDEAAFKSIVDQAKSALADKSKPRKAA